MTTFIPHHLRVDWLDLYNLTWGQLSRELIKMCYGSSTLAVLVSLVLLILGSMIPTCLTGPRQFILVHMSAATRCLIVVPKDTAPQVSMWTVSSCNMRWTAVGTSENMPWTCCRQLSCAPVTSPSWGRESGKHSRGQCRCVSPAPGAAVGQLSISSAGTRTIKLLPLTLGSTGHYILLWPARSTANIIRSAVMTMPPSLATRESMLAVRWDRTQRTGANSWQ